jgi:CRISPR-associated protein Cmr3
MSITSYKVSLRPVSDFFFGNERTLGPSNENYFVRSNRFPQQTTCLGLMRYLLLQMNVWLSDAKGNSAGTKDEITQLIGPKGFRYDQAEKPMDFGAIKSVSPVFLEDGEGIIFPGALNKGYRLNLSEEGEKGEAWTSMNGSSNSRLPILNSFNFKDPVTDHFIHSKTGAVFEPDDLFQSIERVGITKNQGGEAEGSGFFKQVSQQFSREDLYFSFFVELDSTTGDALVQFSQNHVQIPMGGEQSMFKLTVKLGSVEEIDMNQLPGKMDQNTNTPQVLFLSDHYIPIENDLLELTDFSISESMDFRYIKTDVHTKNHHEKPQKSKGFSLLKKGSVLYPKNSDTALEELKALLKDSSKAFRQIGYNAFLTIQDNQINSHFYSYTEENKPS